MIMDNVSEYLKGEARKLHACNKAMRQWPGDGDEQGLVDLWKHSIDFAIDNDFPPAEFIKSNFDRALLNRNLVFVDEYVSLDNAPNGIYVLNGECSGVLRFGQWAAAEIYLRHTTSVRIEAGAYAKLFIRLYDDASVEYDTAEGAVVRVYDRRG